jgi:hypothetical protein
MDSSSPPPIFQRLDDSYHLLAPIPSRISRPTRLKFLPLRNICPFRIPALGAIEKKPALTGLDFDDTGIEFRKSK